jgi:hypothetical protein
MPSLLVSVDEREERLADANSNHVCNETRHYCRPVRPYFLVAPDSNTPALYREKKFTLII